jgi:7-cyano-7-deazaguanine synthase
VLPSEDGQGAAVLCSGGLDSAVLLAEVARERSAALVQPIYVSVGLAWERHELATMDQLLETAPFLGLRPMASLRFDMRDIYPPTHWAIRGEAPGFDTPDEDVYLEGRNNILLTKAGAFMARAKLTRLFLGTLAGNPFPDATPAYFKSMARALSMGLATRIEITTPFAELQKADVIKLGHAIGVPMELTLSCMQPSDGSSKGLAASVHCGRCSKCRERRDAFHAAGIEDPTEYREKPPR